MPKTATLTKTAPSTDDVGPSGLPNSRGRVGLLPRALSSITETTTISYSYDPLYRLTGASYSGSSTSTFAYAYDAVGNRTVQTQTITSTLVTTYGYDIANRLTNVNGVTYSWDDNGNLLNDGMQTYTYDQANRLKTAVQGATTTTFGYNGVGDRLSQTVGVTTTHYVLDPGAGLTQVLSDGTNAYLYGKDRLGQYQASMQYFGADGLGSVRQIIDASATVVGSSRYDPFGNVMSQGGTTSVFAFAGEQQDATGLEYLRARYYSAAQGRFTTRDVWEGDANAPMSYNAWLYVYANAVNGVDPTGLQGPTPGCLPPRICPTPTTPPIVPLPTYSPIYGVPIGSTFDAMEALLVKTTVEDFANRILGGPAAFTTNVKLTGIYKRASVYEEMGYDDTGTFAIYLTPNLLHEYTEGGYTHAAFDIYRPELFPKAKGTGVFPDPNPGAHPDELQKTTFKFTLAHELTHGLQVGNKDVYNSFLDTFWPLKCFTIFGFQTPFYYREEPPTDQSIERNKQRLANGNPIVVQKEVMADAVAARLYAPNLLNHAYDNWIDNVLRTKLR